MHILNTVLGGLVEGLLSPFREFPPLVGLTVVSLVTGVAVLLVVKATSNQQGIKAVKRKIAAGIFEIRLFNDDPRAILRAQADILRHSFTYMGLNLVPVLWMIVPLVLVIIQLQSLYGYAGPEPGGTTLVKVVFNSDAPSVAPDVSLEADPGIGVETPLLWIPSLREAAWRIAVRHPGEHELRVRIGDNVLSKHVLVSEAVVRRSPVRPSDGFIDQLLNPVERPLQGDLPIESITVMYPEASMGFLFWEAHWLVVYFVLSVLVAVALQRPFGVVL